MNSPAPGTTPEKAQKYQFGEFVLFTVQRSLWRDGVRVPLTPKPAETLAPPGGTRRSETLSKEDLLAQVWNARAAVEENNLTQSISMLRRALGEKRGENRFIVTEPGRGYRFVAAVERVTEETAVEAEPVPASPRQRSLATGIVLRSPGVALVRCPPEAFTYCGGHALEKRPRPLPCFRFTTTAPRRVWTISPSASGMA